MLEDRKGVAAIEFALVAPVFLLIFAGLSNYGLLIWRKNQLASGVAQGAMYAFSVGPSVTPDAVASMVKAASKLSNVQVTPSAPACYCLSGTPAAYTTQTCGQICQQDQTSPGTYMTITASYPYQPIMPGFIGAGTRTITDSTFVRLQ